MCSPKPPKPQEIPERQALKLPDGGSTAGRIDDEVHRRRAMMASAYGGSLGLGAASTTSVLGG